MEFINELINIIKAKPTLAIVIGVVLLIAVILLFVFRETKYVIEIVSTAIIETEKACNSKKGQEKLDYAVAIVKSKLPKIVSIFVSKYIIVTLIEFMLNFLGKAFSLEKKIDIIGNEPTNKE